MELIELINAIINHLPYIMAGIGIVIGFLGIRYFKATALWIKGGIEDGDGKLENKELQIAFFSLLAAFEVIMIALHAAEFPSEVIYATFGLAGLAYTANRGFNAWKNTTDAKVNGKDKPETKPESPANTEDDDGSYI